MIGKGLSMDRRKIVVFTGTRAEYGLLRPMLSYLSQCKDVYVILLVSGTHLSRQFGNTIEEIKKDSFAPVHIEDIGIGDNTPLGICSSMSVALERYSRALHELNPDILVVLGDRYEAFCAVTAATILGIPIAYLFGGCTTQGAIDEALRHSMTKMSQLHFATCEVNRHRLLQLGEDPTKVFTVGSFGVENVHNLPVLEEKDVRSKLTLPESVPYFVVTYHPVTQEKKSSLESVRTLLAALRRQDAFYVFTGANADSGGNEINEFLRKEAIYDNKMRFFISLGVLYYINSARYSIGVVGNSSSGVGEIPSLGIPVLNIGERQKGRVCSQAVLHCPDDIESISTCLKKIRTNLFIKQAKETKNPLDIPGTSRTIADIIRSFPLDGITKKTFFDIT